MSNKNETIIFADKLHEITYKKEQKVVMIQDLTNGYFINLPDTVFFQTLFKILSIISFNN